MKKKNSLSYGHYASWYLESLQKEISNASRLLPPPREGAFPTEVFPRPAQQLIRDLTSTYNFNPEYLAATMLFIAGAAIGNSYRLKTFFEVTSCLYMALVGNPGENKSGPIQFLIKVLQEWDKQLNQKYLQELAVYEAVKEQCKRTKTTPPSPPRPSRLLFCDATGEAIMAGVADNPRGICLWNDELVSFLNATSRTSPYFLSMWSGSPVYIDRRTSTPKRIEYSFAPVIGTIQTNILREVLARNHRSENGLIDRFQFVMPQGMERRLWRNVAPQPELETQWATLIQKLLALQPRVDEHGNLHPHYLFLTPEAESALIAWQHRTPYCPYALDKTTINRICAKSESHALRYTLILHLLEQVCGEHTQEKIDEGTVEKALKVTEYFRTTSFKIFEFLSQKNPLDQLSADRLVLYEKLCSSFKTEEGLKICKLAGMSERTFKYWLATSPQLFRRIGHGHYEKVYKAY